MIMVMHFWRGTCCCCDNTNLFHGHTSLYCSRQKFGVAGGHTDPILKRFKAVRAAEKIFGQVTQVAYIPSEEDTDDPESGRGATESTSLLPYLLSEKRIEDWAPGHARTAGDCADVVFAALAAAGADRVNVSKRALGRVFYTPENAYKYAVELANAASGMLNIDSAHYKKMCSKIEGYNEFVANYLNE